MHESRCLPRKNAIIACLNGKEIEFSVNPGGKLWRRRFNEEEQCFETLMYGGWDRTSHWDSSWHYHIYEESLPKLLWPKWVDNVCEVSAIKSTRGWSIRVEYNSSKFQWFEFFAKTEGEVVKIWNTTVEATNEVISLY